MAGQITPEHILLRVEGMLAHDFGEPGGAAYDESGFIAALVADGWRASEGITVRMHPDDHPPPHVHVRFPQRPNLRIRLALDTGEPLDGGVPDGWSRKLRRVSDFVVSSKEPLMARWIEMHGSSATSSPSGPSTGRCKS